ncbi:TssN family type VI secretion system protein [Myroides odoratus]|uniref:TssN family type VI secretion system protein n=1 Tax=Myroides odoratus TaxID=256 RepID=UPI0039B0564A
MYIEFIKAYFLNYLILPILLLGLVILLGFLKKKIQFIKTKELIVYVLVSVLILALPGFLGFYGNAFNPYGYLIASSFYFLFGMVHVNQVFKRFQGKDIPEWQSLSFEGILTALNLLFGMYLFTYIFDWVSPFKGYAFISATCSISYLIPLFFYYSYLQFLKIPFSIYKTWRYEKNKQTTDFEGIDFNKLLVVTVELAKNVKDGNQFRIKAKTLSSGVTFGDWFHKVLEDYNYKNGTTTIELSRDNGEYYDWVFYLKRSLFHFKKYIDFDLDISQNKIKENDIIICKRVSEYK